MAFAQLRCDSNRCIPNVYGATLLHSLEVRIQAGVCILGRPLTSTRCLLGEMHGATGAMPQIRHALLGPVKLEGGSSRRNGECFPHWSIFRSDGLLVDAPFPRTNLPSSQCEKGLLLHGSVHHNSQFGWRSHSVKVRSGETAEEEVADRGVIHPVAPC